MYSHNISRTVQVDAAMAPVAAGTGDTQTGFVVDAAGFESVLFGVYFGTITASAVTTVKVQQGSASDGSDMADISGSSVSVPDTGDNLLFFAAEVHRPTKRYLRVAVVRATANAVINSGVVVLGRSAIQPAALGAKTGNSVLPAVVVSP